MRVRVLGPTEVVTAAGEPVALPGAKMRGVVAMLALEPGATLSASRLIDAVWGDQQTSGANVVQVVVSKLRRILAAAGETERIVTDPSGYRLAIGRGDVDTLRFEVLVDQARAATADPEDSFAILQEALALWRGPPLVDIPSTSVTDALAARLQELREVAVEDLVDVELALGRHRRLAAEVEALAAAEPLRERRWGQLMRALYGSGQQADALRAFQRARDVLIEEMGVEPGTELRRLEAAVLAQDDAVLVGPAGPSRTTASSSAPTAVAPSDAAPVGGGFRRRGNVRHPVGACIGRKDDLRRLLHLVERHRLVTLTGPGGVGKTRLALEVAVTVLPDVPDGVWWVDLAAARTLDDVVAALQATLRVEPSATVDPLDAVAAIAEALGDGEAVFVVDNCEQLADAVTTVIEELLGRCPGVRVLATSRAALGIPAEVVFTVAPLEHTAAMALFEDRIAGLGEADRAGAEATIAEICERLDHLPLALELAAARARHLSLDEILGRLADRFDLLRDRSGAPAGHQGDLRAVADWSYDLLDDEERLVFERLSVFAAGATAAAAAQVCAGAGVDPADVEDVLARLVDKSLVYADRSGPGTRYRMLQTLYDYAGDRLVGRGDQEARRAAHAHWVRDLASAVRFGARTTGVEVAAVQDEDVAVRDAIGWALAADPTLAVELCSLLSPFWFGTMRVSIGSDLLSRSLAAADGAGVDGPEHGAALGWGVVFSAMVHDRERAEALAERATASETGHGDPGREGRLWFCRALAAGYQGDPAAAQWTEEARRCFVEAGSRLGLGWVCFAEGARRLVDGDLDGAEAGLADAVEVFRAEQDHLGSILAVSRSGELAWRRGDVDRFADLHRELLELGHEGRSPGVVIGATARLALARLEQGAIDEAQALAGAALAGTGETFMAVINGYAFKSGGLVNLHLGHVAEGREQLRLAIDAFERGAGNVGVGLAATCWIDLSRSYCEAGEDAEARSSASAALATAEVAGDPWVIVQAEAHWATLPPPAG